MSTNIFPAHLVNTDELYKKNKIIKINKFKKKIAQVPYKPLL